MEYSVNVMKRTGEVVVYNKDEAELLAILFNAKIINASRGGYLVTTNIK